MELYLERISKVEAHFAGNDYDLGFRLLLDCVLDAGHHVFYRKTIGLADAFYKRTEDPMPFKEQVEDLIYVLKQHPVSASDKAEILVEARHICKHYKNFTLGPININIKQGDVWGLVGENGNGKTTLLRILSADLHYNSGEISYFFTTHKSDYDLRTQLVFIPQRTPKSYGSIIHNLKYTAAQYGVTGEENELLALMYIIRFGLWPYKDMKWSALSSGYKMRFELAKTLLRRPKILILDEPLANLDVLTQQVILEDLKNIGQSLSNPLGIILSSQQLFEVEKIANHVLFLKQGKPTNLHEQNKKNASGLLIVELDIQCTKAELTTVLSHLNDVEIDYNGGTFIIETSSSTFKSLMSDLLQSTYDITYIRDISHSSRRLFTK